MRPDAALLREIVRLLRAANDGDDEASRRLDVLAANYRPSLAPLDGAAAVAELRDAANDVSPETRYALARWIAGRIALKRGRKSEGLRRTVAAPQRPPLDGELCIRALLAFGSTSAPLGLHPNTRAALAELLTGTRRLKRGPHLAPPATLRTLFAAISARHYAAQGMKARPALRRAAAEAGVKYGTLQRRVYPRTK